MSTYIHFTEEQKQQAASVDLEVFLRCHGEKLLASGREKRLASDHSVTVRGNEWYDHAEGRGGHAVSFVQRFYNLSYKAALYAMELLKLEFSDDEQVVCISENDACGVDAIQALLGCSIGKGNLLFHLRGKQAFSFYNRRTGNSVRLVLKPRPEGMSREESFAYLQGKEPKELFEVKPAVITLPEPARLFDSYVCDCCGETTGANWIRLAGDKKLCLDCYPNYNRFEV
ncbi:FmdE family protein [Candidatus Avoscillospira sp. LCP25S3_F1]|uniref:FmdE family protein n=1 Tax=Candidatus Avoscillospira sp. LCP25S3_F1 TaxID=3438825 RepID=UPI003F91046C